MCRLRYEAYICSEAEVDVVKDPAPKCEHCKSFYPNNVQKFHHPRLIAFGYIQAFAIKQDKYIGPSDECEYEKAKIAEMCRTEPVLIHIDYVFA